MCTFKGFTCPVCNHGHLYIFIVIGDCYICACTDVLVFYILIYSTYDIDQVILGL